MSKEKIFLEKLSSLLLKKHKQYYFIYIILLFVASIFQVIGIGSMIPLTAAFFEDSSNSILINNLKDILELRNNISNFKIILIFTTSTIILSNIVF